MADDTKSYGQKDPAVEREENRLRKAFGATDETTFTIRQPLDDDDIEVVTVAFTVPTSALLEKMVVSKAASSRRKDSFFADNDGEDAEKDPEWPAGDAGHEA
jgi:hypothetical protein